MSFLNTGPAERASVRASLPLGVVTVSTGQRHRRFRQLTQRCDASDNSAMELRFRQLPFALDPLIAEAKRRARQRRVLLVAVVLVLGFGAGGTTLAAHPFGWFRASRPYSGPFVPGGMFTGTGGIGFGGSYPGLQAVSAASRSDAWIIGSVARRWDGHAWRDVALPKEKGTVYLWSVAARASNDAWAAGWRDRGGFGPHHALIEHWNGASWSVVRLPRLGDSLLYDVSASGSRSAWAVGAIFRRNPGRRYPVAWPLLLHWDGASWRRQVLPWAYSALQLDKVVATGPSSVWVVSGEDQQRSRIEHWNGTRWRLVHAPFGSNDPLAGFSATAWNDAWAVGSYGLGDSRVAKYSHALAAHWNGYHWKITPIPNPPRNTNSAALVDVAAARPDDAWALGVAQHLVDQGRDGISATGPVAYFVRWNGRNWQVASGVSPPIYDGTQAITATADGSAWAIGNCQSDDFSLRWNNNAWVTAPHPRDTNWRTTPTARPRPPRPPTCSSSASAG